jgi:hypothetical protein
VEKKHTSSRRKRRTNETKFSMAQGNVFKSSAAAKMAKALRKKKAAANKHGRGGMTTKRGEKSLQCSSTANSLLPLSR